MERVVSAGILLFHETPEKSFLLLRSKKNWDIPKGHVEPDETELEGAFRELREETFIEPEQVRLDETFRFELQRQFEAAYLGGRLVDKSYVVFLGYVSSDVIISVTEHEYFEWFPWNPPHRVNSWLIDPLLEAVSRHFDGQQ